MSGFQIHAECPTLAELREFAAGHDESLRSHVESCRRCLALVRRIEERGAVGGPADEAMPAFERPRVAREGGEVEGSGDVVIASSPDAGGTLLVCVVLDLRGGSEPATLEVAPISAEVASASELDVVLPMGDPLGYPALVEVWNHGTLIWSQVEERLGRVPKPAAAQVDALYRSLHGDAVVAVNEIARGVAIASADDPRAEFQDAEAERAVDFWKPAARLYSGAEQVAPAQDALTISDVLSDYFERTGLDIPSYAASINWPEEEVAALCAPELEPGTLRPERIGIALQATGASEEDFRSALEHSLRDEQFMAGTRASGGGLAFTREAPARRAGRRSAPKVSADPAAERRRYISRALRAFDSARKKCDE